MSGTEKSALIIPPYVGEFGWELMGWQGVVRRVLSSRRGARAWVFFAPGRRELYADLLDEPAAVDLIECPIDDVPGEPSEDHRIDADGRRVPPEHLRRRLAAAMQRTAPDSGDGVFLWPSFTGRLVSTTRAEQSFRRLGLSSRIDIDVLLIPRRRTLAAERDAPPAWWDGLAAALTGRGLRVDVYQPPLRRCIEQLSRARLAAGGSTGGLHLASLCDCPHLVWGPDDSQRWTEVGFSNRQRYETLWNPLGTPVQYAALGWRPSIAACVDRIAAAIETIGRGAPTATRAVGRLRWAARRRLAACWARRPEDGMMPWRVREFVRTRMT